MLPRHDGGFQTSFMAGRARLAKKMAGEPEFADIALRRLMNRSLFVFRVRAFFSRATGQPFFARDPPPTQVRGRRGARAAVPRPLRRDPRGVQGEDGRAPRARVDQARRGRGLLRRFRQPARARRLRQRAVEQDVAFDRADVLAPRGARGFAQDAVVERSVERREFFLSNSRRETRRNPTLSPLVG